jgi:thymidine kinase
MFNGKTEFLVRTYKKKAEEGHRVLAVNPHLDTRAPAGRITSHSGESVPATSVRSLSEAFALVVSGGYLFVDEGQFFADLAPACAHLADDVGVHVYAAALNGTCRREAWSSVSAAIPLASSIVWADFRPCSGCAAPSSCFTHKIAGDKSAVIEIGGCGMYECMCRRCYVEAVKA